MLVNCTVAVNAGSVPIMRLRLKYASASMSRCDVSSCPSAMRHMLRRAKYRGGGGLEAGKTGEQKNERISTSVESWLDTLPPLPRRGKQTAKMLLDRNRKAWCERDGVLAEILDIPWKGRRANAAIHQSPTVQPRSNPLSLPPITSRLRSKLVVTCPPRSRCRP